MRAIASACGSPEEREDVESQAERAHGGVDLGAFHRAVERDPLEFGLSAPGGEGERLDPEVGLELLARLIDESTLEPLGSEEGESGEGQGGQYEECREARRAPFHVSGHHSKPPLIKRASLGG